MALITVSRQSGSRGEEITEQIAKVLGLRLIDKPTLEKTLLEHGLSEENVERFDEKKPGFRDIFSNDRDRYFHYLKSAILENVRSGDNIVIGRGAAVVLAGLPGTLHLRITAPITVRIERVREQQECDEHHARRMVHHIDHERAGFYHVFFNVDWEDPDIYDLTVNTATLSADVVVDTIRSIVESDAMESARARREKRITELAKAQRILTKILYEEQIPLRFPWVDVTDDVAVVSGSVSVATNVERCEAVAAATEGIGRVEVRITCLPENYDGPYV